VIHLITHTDLDGVACAVVVKHFYDDVAVKVTFANYRNIDSIATTSMLLGKTIFFTDIVPSRKWMAEAAEKGLCKDREVTFIDHHAKNALGDGTELPDGTASFYSPDHCGAWLTMRVLEAQFGRKVPVDMMWWLEAVNARDLWLDVPSRQRGDDLHTMTQILGFHQSVEYFGDRSGRSLVKHINPKLLLRRDKSDLESTIESCKRSARDFVDDQGRKYRYTVVAKHVSKVGEALGMDPDISYVMMWVPQRNTIEMRSNEAHGIDVGAIAKSRGGGGHKHASGYTLRGRPAPPPIFMEDE
jgi:oligoribonuclease NrnB/cAMP/cGMP phosphodiesterase (DHH superfamily)